MTESQSVVEAAPSMEPNGPNQDRLPLLKGGRELWGVIGFAPKKTTRYHLNASGRSANHTSSRILKRKWFTNIFFNSDESRVFSTRWIGTCV